MINRTRTYGERWRCAHEALLFNVSELLKHGLVDDELRHASMRPMSKRFQRSATGCGRIEASLMASSSVVKAGAGKSRTHRAHMCQRPIPGCDASDLCEHFQTSRGNSNSIAALARNSIWCATDARPADGSRRAQGCGSCGKPERLS